MTALKLTCLGLVVFSLAYVATAMFPIPLPAYDPVAEHWAWVGRPGPVQMRYYGQVATALLMTALVTLPLSRFVRQAPEEDPSTGLYVLWAATAILLCLAYFAWHNWP